MALCRTCEGLKFYAAGFLKFFFFFSFFFSFSFYVHIFTVILHSCSDLGLIHSQNFLLAFVFFCFFLPSLFLFLLYYSPFLYIKISSYTLNPC